MRVISYMDILLILHLYFLQMENLLKSKNKYMRLF